MEQEVEQQEDQQFEQQHAQHREKQAAGTPPIHIGAAYAPQWD